MFFRGSKTRRFIMAGGWIALGLAGCSEPPPMPVLPGPTGTRAERILLGNSLEAKNIRELFEAVNEDGRLESFAPLVRDATDEELNALGELLTSYVYQPALDRNSLVSLLQDRVRRRSFSRLRRASRGFGRSPINQRLASLLSVVVRSPYFVEILERDVGYLSPELDQSLAELQFKWEGVLEAQAAASTSERIPSDQIVQDLQRFLAQPKLKQRWLNLSDSLSNSWPVVGLLDAVHQVNEEHGGNAFDGIGDGLSRMVRQPRHAGKPLPPSQFDSLMDLMLALEGPSNGLFTSIQEKLDTNFELVREIGSLIQPNVPNELLGYSPVIPNRFFATLLKMLQSPEMEPSLWVNMGKGAAEAYDGMIQFYILSKTAHEFIKGAPRNPAAPDYISFNLPLFLNNYVLARWVEKILQSNAARLPSPDSPDFFEKLLAMKVKTAAFDFSFTTQRPYKTVFNPEYLKELENRGLKSDSPVEVFAPERLEELSNLGLTDLVTALDRNTPYRLGNFHYSIPEMTELTFKEALHRAVLSIDKIRGFADGSSLLRVGILDLIERNGGGRSYLENLETDDLLLSTHRFINSTPIETWKHLRSVLFEGIGLQEMSEDTRSILLSLYEGNPKLAERFARLLDSVGMLNELDSPPKEGISAFEAYVEIVRKSGPREWKALSDGWLFLADSRLFSMEQAGTGEAVARYPSAHAWLSQGNTAGLLRLASDIQPARYRPLADFVHDTMRELQGVSGSEVHWDFFQGLVESSPDGVAALIDHLREGAPTNLREILSEYERTWLVSFVTTGALRKIWQMVHSGLRGGDPAQWLSKLRQAAQDGTLAKAFRVLGLVQDDRIQALTRLFQEWESSGELIAFLETLEELFQKGSGGS